MAEHTWKYIQETPDIEDCVCTVCGYRRTYRRISTTGWQPDPFVQMTSCPNPPDDLILLPRALVAALVDDDTARFVDGTYLTCNFCDANYYYGPEERLRIHADDCPIRILQERLKETP